MAARKPSHVRKVSLGCGCVETIPYAMYRLGEEYRCPSHGETYIRGKITEWRLRCDQCGYSRGFGEGRVTAECKAAHHSLMRGHSVSLLYGEELRSVMKRDDIPTLDDCEPPPF